jgi:hypothetical protein
VALNLLVYLRVALSLFLDPAPSLSWVRPTRLDRNVSRAPKRDKRGQGHNISETPSPGSPVLWVGSFTFRSGLDNEERMTSW